MKRKNSVRIPYGNKKITLKLNNNTKYDLVMPNEATTTRDKEEKEISKALQLNHKKIKKVFMGKGKTIGIAVNDPTRPIPNQLILPPLLKFIYEFGFDTSEIIFFIATGTHKAPDIKDVSDYLPQEITEVFRTVVHDCDKQSDLKFIGKSKFNTPINVNKEFYTCDIKILVGHIEPHHFMGYSGGVKSAAIGLCGRETIEANHSMIKHKMAKIGIFNKNPMRMDVEEIGKHIGVDLVFNVILNSEKQIMHAFFGDPYEVMLLGIEKCKEFCAIEKSNDYDLVIASPGGYPKDINLYQSQKAITHACTLLKSNGIVILVAECREGAGSTSFIDFFDGKRSCEDVITSFNKMKFSVGPHKAYQLALQRKDHPIILISDLPKSQVEDIFLIYAKDLENALEIAFNFLPEDLRIAVLPYATHIMAIK